MGPTKNLLAVALLLAGLLMSSRGFAIEVSFPEDELPSETVTPLLDIPDAVVKPLISTTKRFEFEVTGGDTLDETFYNGLYESLELYYFTGEQNGFGIKTSFWNPGLSSYSTQLASTTKPLNLGRAPGPSQYDGLVYKDRFFYGKVSLSKDTILPLTMSLLAELGAIQYGSNYYPSVAAAFSNQLYLNRHWSIDAKFRLVVHQELDPLSVNLQSSAPAPSQSQFGAKYSLNSQIELGIGYLF